nr:AI-2E family transporter [Elusimicrobiaceae bacterium]
QKIPIPEEFVNFSSIREVLSLPYYTTFLRGIGSNAMTFISYAFLVCIFLFFFLIGSGRTKITNDVLKEIQNKISAYLYIHIIMSLVTGFCVWVVYVSCGLDLAIMFAALTVLLNFIPNIGSVAAVLLPLPIAYLQFEWGIKFVLILALPSVIQFVLGSLIEPKILGEGVDLHPITVIASLIVWGLVWGIPGAFLAVPMTAALRIILARLEPTRPFAELLSGRLPK